MRQFRMGQWALALTAITIVSPGATGRAEDLAYVNYWDLTTSPSPIELRLGQNTITHMYLPNEITPSQGVPVGQHSIWLSKPQQQVTTTNLEAGEFYTVVLFQQAASMVKGIVLNDTVVRPEPILRLVNLTSKPVQINSPALSSLSIKPGEQRDVPVVINNASSVGLVTVNAKSTSPDNSTQGIFGVGPDHASVLLIHQLGPNLKLTRWQYDQCTVRIQTLKYEDACGHSD